MFGKIFNWIDKNRSKNKDNYLVVRFRGVEIRSFSRFDVRSLQDQTLYLRGVSRRVQGCKPEKFEIECTIEDAQRKVDQLSSNFEEISHLSLRRS